MRTDPMEVGVIRRWLLAVALGPASLCAAVTVACGGEGDTDGLGTSRAVTSPATTGLIAYTRFPETGEPEPSLFTIRSDGTQPRRLVENAWQPAWSRDGRLAFVDSGQSIAVARADGKPTR